MRRERKKKRIIIFILISLLFVMIVGYAAFQTKLEIKGTSNISSEWRIEITNVLVSNKNGLGENVNFEHTKTTASMEANLYEKGDYVEYNVEVSNLGTLDAEIDNIANNIKSTNKAVKISFSGYAKGQVLKAKEKQTIKVKIEYDSNYSGTAPEGPAEVEVQPEYIQHNPGGTTPLPDRYLVSYDCISNGGKDCSENNEYLTEGDEINLNPSGVKEGYIFVGWNTEKTATSGITSLSMGKDNIVLYAIYKAVPQLDVSDTTVSVGYNNETIDIPYTYDGDGVVSCTSSNESYTTCSVNTSNKTITITGKAYTTTKPTITIKAAAGTNYSEASDKIIAVTLVDNVKPECEITVTKATIDNVTLNAKCEDVTGLSNYKLSVDSSGYTDKGTTTSYTVNSLNLSTINLKVTDNSNNSGVYKLSDSNLEKGYQMIYDVLNNKYKAVLQKEETYANNFLNKTHPVGSIYVTTTYTTAAQVNSALGGTWEVYGSGRALVGVNTSDSNFNTVGKTGGTSTNTLAVTNMPSHTHSIPVLSGTAASAGAHTHSIPALSGSTNSAGSHRHSIGQENNDGSMYGWAGAEYTSQIKINYNYNDYMCDTAGAHTHTVTTKTSTTGSNGAHTHNVTTKAGTSGASGSGTAFTNLQPYITVYMYKRTS